MCGEHLNALMEYTTAWGSSPRVRRTPVERHAPQFQVGIIPACAGNTRSESSERWPPGDHPRVCGEHYTPNWDVFWNVGSSPRVRGTPGDRQVRHGRAGIIPACAGNTCASGRTIPTSGDHPRVCGEHSLISACNRSMPGSSPRVRGTRRGRRVPIAGRGIIPACAGNTGRGPRRHRR